MDNNLKTYIKNVITATEDSINFILPTDSILEITEELLEEGIEFVEFDYDEFLDLADENEILSLAKNTYKDGTQDYFVDKVFSNSGITLYDESDYVYIDSDLLEDIDVTKFSGDIIELGEEEENEECDGNCKCCNECGEDNEEVYAENEFDDDCLGDCQTCDGCEEETEEDDIDDFLEFKVQEFADLLEENIDNDEFCFFCNLKSLLEDIYMDAHNCGFEDGKATITEELEELLDRVTE